MANTRHKGLDVLTSYQGTRVLPSLGLSSVSFPPGIPTTGAQNAATTHSNTTRAKATRNSTRFATKPITAGPAIMPPYPHVVIVARAEPLSCVDRRPAALTTRGNGTARPIPTKPRPTNATGAQGNSKARVSPSAASEQAHRMSRTVPKRVVILSPTLRPRTTQAKNVAKPVAAKPAPVTSLNISMSKRPAITPRTFQRSRLLSADRVAYSTPFHYFHANIPWDDPLKRVNSTCP
jgi:hypothetical protein